MKQKNDLLITFGISPSDHFGVESILEQNFFFEIEKECTQINFKLNIDVFSSVNFEKSDKMAFFGEPISKCRSYQMD